MVVVGAAVLVVLLVVVDGGAVVVVSTVGVGDKAGEWMVVVEVVDDVGAEVVTVSPHPARAKAVAIAHAMSGRRRPCCTAAD